jgi:2Fe-2S ferredoxin
MPDISIELTDRKGHVIQLLAPTGSTLMAILKESGLPVAATCGGAKSCATCHVWVGEGYARVGPPDDDEADLLSESDHYRESFSRLSCQILLQPDWNGMQIELAPRD